MGYVFFCSGRRSRVNVVNRNGGQSGRWSIGTVVKRDGGQSGRWSIGIVVLLEMGLSESAVAIRIGINRWTVSRVFSRYQETDSYRRRPGQGRPRVTMNPENSNVVNETLSQQGIRDKSGMKLYQADELVLKR